VPFYLDNKFADVGVVASYSGVAKSIEKTGHKVLHKSVSQPYFPLIAHKRFTSEQVRAMQTELAKLPDSEAGKEVLLTIGIKAFDTQGGERMLALLKWLEG
jgi:phosphonate transport system substrate-binding protein